MVHDAVTPNFRRAPSSHEYLVLNYEKFQIRSSSRLVRDLLDCNFDFVVLDEVQFVKQRGTAASKRRQTLTGLLANIAERAPDLRVLAMSATPVTNNLLEAKAL